MEILERAIYLGIGCCLGWFANEVIRSLRQIKEELHVEEHKDELPRKNEQGSFRMPSWRNIAVAVAVLLTGYAAVMSQVAVNRAADNAKEDQISRCEAGVDSRNVQRAIVDAVYNLATGVADRPAGADKLTPDQVEQYNAYVDRVNAFRNDLYAKIKPSEECAPFVEDDNVKPPSKPFPIIPLNKEE